MNIFNHNLFTDKPFIIGEKELIRNICLML